MVQPDRTTAIAIMVAAVILFPVMIISSLWNSLSEEEARVNAQQRGFTVIALHETGTIELNVTYGDTGCTGILHFGDKKDDPVTLTADVPVPGSVGGVTTTSVDNPTVIGLRDQPAFGRCFATGP